MWLYGNVATWLCGYVAKWLSGKVAKWSPTHAVFTGLIIDFLSDAWSGIVVAIRSLPSSADFHLKRCALKIQARKGTQQQEKRSGAKVNRNIGQSKRPRQIEPFGKTRWSNIAHVCAPCSCPAHKSPCCADIASNLASQTSNLFVKESVIEATISRAATFTRLLSLEAVADSTSEQEGSGREEGALRTSATLARSHQYGATRAMDKTSTKTWAKMATDVHI